MNKFECDLMIFKYIKQSIDIVSQTTDNSSTLSLGMSQFEDYECPWEQLWEPPKIGDLTVDLLESNPREYQRILEYLLVESDSSQIIEKLNEKPYETWYSNHIFSLSRLVGELNSKAQNRENYPQDSFYGSRNRKGIPTELAINLLRTMLNAGGDITEKDYYGKNVVEYLKEGENGSIFYRTGNEEYTGFVEKVFTENHSTTTDSPEEGIPPENQ